MVPFGRVHCGGSTGWGPISESRVGIPLEGNLQGSSRGSPGGPFRGYLRRGSLVGVPWRESLGRGPWWGSLGGLP
jgi:hypothetical protein